MFFSHLISNDSDFTTAIKRCPTILSKLSFHDHRERFVHCLSPSNKTLVFVDIDDNSESENAAYISILKTLTNKLIVVSKDTSFAYQAIKAGIYDYVLKSDFTNSPYFTSEPPADTKSVNASFLNKIAIHCNDATHYLKVDEIIRCRAEGNYSWIVMTHKNILIAKTLKKIETLLPPSLFCRTHRSHLVNINYIKMIKHEKGGIITTSDDFDIPISRSRRSNFFDKIQSSMM